MMRDYFDAARLWPWRLPVMLVLAGVGPLGVAYYAELVQGYEPCVLCLYQRIPFAVAAGLGIMALLRPIRVPLPHPAFGLAGGVVFVVGAGLAFYHVGVEQHWWASAASCGGALPDQISVSDFRKQLTVKPEKSCDAVDWTLFGISMATYNVVYSLLAAAVFFASAIKNGAVKSKKPKAI